MSYMQWSETLATGIDVIDEQHKRIIFYINELKQISQDGSAKDIRHVMDGLIDYTITHFQFEEELQERAGYLFLDAHKREHDIFKDRVATFIERANQGEDVVHELLFLLKVWLSSHIKGDDRDYVESVKKVASSSNQENVLGPSSMQKRFSGNQICDIRLTKVEANNQRKEIMGHNSQTTLNDEPKMDISSCLVHRTRNRLALCMKNDEHCHYALPYGNICKHPLVDQIAEADQ